MPGYSENIQSRADVMRFFVHLRYDMKVAFSPDQHFEDFARIGKNQRKFTEEESRKLADHMDACRKWCTSKGENIYRIAEETLGFPSFLEGHERITDKDKMKKFAREFIDEDFEIESTIALHTYGGCYWIEEFIHAGRPHFQCVIENTNPWSEDLREVEVELYEWSEPKNIRKLGQRR
jgi:hypothetical protein